MVFEIWQVFHNIHVIAPIESTFLFCSFGVQETLSSFFSLLQCTEVGIHLLLSCSTEQFVSDRDGQLFVIPFAKSATTGQHSPVGNSFLVCQMIFSKMYRITQDTLFCKWMTACLYIVVLINLI